MKDLTDFINRHNLQGVLRLLPCIHVMACCLTNLADGAIYRSIVSPRLARTARASSIAASSRRSSSSLDDATSIDRCNDLLAGSPPKWAKFPDGSRFWKTAGGSKLQRPIFVAATRQHVGKTTCSLALMSGKISFGERTQGRRQVNANALLEEMVSVCCRFEYFY